MNFTNRKSRFILNKVLSLAVSVALFGGLALTASAQTNPPQAIPSDYGLTATATGAGLPTGEANPIKIVATVVNTLLGFLGAMLVIMVIYAGFLWMTAAGYSHLYHQFTVPRYDKYSTATNTLITTTHPLLPSELIV